MEGLLLAAGAGRRMGTPKALVRDDAGSWLVRGVTTLYDGGCRRVTVVLGAAAGEAGELLSGLRVRRVVAADWEEGMGASLRAGLHALADSPDHAVVVSLVDLPDLVPAVVARLIGATSEAGSAALARATYDGRPGHPVVLGRDHWPGVLQTAVGDRGARDYLASHEVMPVECADLASGRDVDTPPSR